MAHLSVAKIVEFASSQFPAEARDHLDSCPDCRRILETASDDPGDSGPEDCSRLEPLLHDLAGGRLARGECAELERHLAECEACLDDASACATTPELPLQRVSRRHYARGALIDEGGMGRLRRATDLRLGREVAIKELRDVGMLPRFEQEARLTAKLQHPAIVGVLEAGLWDDDGSPFYVMELVEGERLDHRIARCRKLEDRLALLPSVITVAEALAYAHEKEIVHRDVKPQNVMVGEYGESVLIDWGLAKDLGKTATAEGRERPADRPTRDGWTEMGIGTPPYMPPEQAAGEPSTPRIDVYALGATIYHLFAGRPPYGGGCTREDVLSSPPPSLEAVAPRDTPREIKSIVAKAMARDPKDRFANAKALAQELVRFQTGRLVRSHRYSFLDKSRHWWRRYRTRIRGRFAIAMSVVLGIAGLGSLGRIVYERNRAEMTAASLLVEQGRQEFLNGSSMRALAYLDEAANQGAKGPTLRYLLAAASRDVSALERTIPGEVVAIAPDGTHVLGNDADGVASEWSWEAPPPGEPEKKTRFRGRAIAFADDGRSILTVEGTRVLQIDRATGETRQTFAASGEIWFAAFGIEGRVLALEKEGLLRIWKADGSLSSTTTVRPRTHPDADRLSRDRRRLVLSEFGGNRIEVVDVLDGRKLAEIDTPAAIFQVDLSPDGTRVVSGGADRTATIWEVATRRPVHVLRGHAGIVLAVAFTPDGSRVVTVSDAAECRIWDAETGALLASVETGDRFSRLQVSPDGHQIATAQLGNLKLWSTTNGTRLAALEAPEKENATDDRIGFSAAGDHVFLAGTNRSHVWSTRKGRLLFENSVRSGARLVPLASREHVSVESPAGRTYWAMRGADLHPAFEGTPNAWLPLPGDKSSMMTLTSAGAISRDSAWTVEMGAPVSEGMLSPDGRTLQVRADQTITLLDVETGAQKMSVTLESESGRILWAACPDASCVIAGRMGRPVHLYEADGSAPRMLEDLVADDLPNSSTLNARVTDDGAWVLAYVLTSAIPLRADIRVHVRKSGKLWDEHETSSLSFDAWGEFLATVEGSSVKISKIQEKGGRVWTVRTEAGALDLGFIRPSGALLATTGYDGIARVWNWRSGKLLEELGGQAPRVSYDASFFSCCDNFTFLTVDGEEGRERLWARNGNTTTLWDVHLAGEPVVDEGVRRRVPWVVRQGRLILPNDRGEDEAVP